jgi:hypothetical protein
MSSDKSLASMADFRSSDLGPKSSQPDSRPAQLEWSEQVINSVSGQPAAVFTQCLVLLLIYACRRYVCSDSSLLRIAQSRDTGDLVSLTNRRRNITSSALALSEQYPLLRSTSRYHNKSLPETKTKDKEFQAPPLPRVRRNLIIVVHTTTRMLLRSRHLVLAKAKKQVGFRDSSRMVQRRLEVVLEVG